MTQKTNPWTFDVRVRERNLKAGSITDKDVEKYVAGLPDLTEHSEAFATSQPALAQPVVVEEELGADEEDDEEEVAVAAPVVAAPVAAAPVAEPQAPAEMTETANEPSNSPE